MPVCEFEKFRWKVSCFLARLVLKLRSRYARPPYFLRNLPEF